MEKVNKTLSSEITTILPNELNEIIISYLKKDEVSKLSATCTSWRYIIAQIDKKRRNQIIDKIEIAINKLDGNYDCTAAFCRPFIISSLVMILLSAIWVLTYIANRDERLLGPATPAVYPGIIAASILLFFALYVKKNASFWIAKKELKNHLNFFKSAKPLSSDNLKNLFTANDQIIEIPNDQKGVNEHTSLLNSSNTRRWCV